ncbi:Rieske [2Fe-2S] iron-sulfur domain-containing protein [Mariannaea sp. PMI_226]|nr:Rieske [2Fe-2S] iron-sulfur domain-containing protein [Mariannaea sp. PMI_226]
MFELAPHLFFCGLALLVTAISLNSRRLLHLINSTFNPNAASRPSSYVPNDQISKQAPPRLLQGWWTKDSVFQLEQRAIFSKTWICVSHQSRFVNPGDYVSYELAGFRFFVIMGKDKVIRTFHNVCRHRAFPITKKATGSSTVLGCGYHGWSYDSKGQLIKAPQFDRVPGFSKSENSLFEIHTKVDKYGFLHINFNGTKEAADTPIAPERIVGRPAKINPSSRFLGSLEYKGKFNWKAAANAPFQVGNETSSSFPSRTSGKIQSVSTGSSTPVGQLHFFPLTTIYTKAGSAFWYQITYAPDSAKQTTVRCDVYSAKTNDPLQFEGAVKENLDSLVKANIESFEKAYAKLASSNYDVPEDGGYDQAEIAEVVGAHLKKETIEGREIRPAAVQQCKSAAFMQAEGIAEAIECGSTKLSW